MNDSTEAVAEQPKARRVTVTGDIGEYLQGQILKDDAAIAVYYRTVFNEDPPGGPCKLSDEEILECIDAVPGDGEDVEVERIENHMTPKHNAKA